MSDHLTRWEKAALLTTGAASAFNVLLWALAATLGDAAPALTPLGVLRVLFAVLSFLSLDLVVVVVVMAMRAGRRGLWSELAAAGAAGFAALIALEVAGVVAWPWLHAAPALVLYAFMRHLATESRSALAAARAELSQARDALAAAVTARDAAAAEGQRAWDAASEARADADHWRGVASQAASRPALAADHDTLLIGGRSYSTRDAAAALGMSKTTLARRLAGVGQGDA